MSATDKKILLWIGTGSNQKALANKIASKFNVCGIIVDQKRAGKKQPFLKKAFAGLLDRVFFKSISNAWFSMQEKYAAEYPGWPSVPIINVDSINGDDAFAFTQQQSPDLIVVSGTSLVKSKMLSIKPSIGIVNLHTGLSPYIKGGPNCTNWCISTAQYHKIGNTIMWINEGIDAGNIITSECTSFSDKDSLASVHWQVMQHAHDLYLRSIDYLLNAVPPFQSVPQKDIDKGELYLTRMWDRQAKKNLLKNWNNFKNTDTGTKSTALHTVPLKIQYAP